MIAAWMGFSLLITLLFVLVGLAIEPILLQRKLPTRGLWLVLLCSAAVLPIFAVLSSRVASPSTLPVDVTMTIVQQPNALETVAQPSIVDSNTDGTALPFAWRDVVADRFAALAEWASPFDRALLIAWLALSVLMLSALLLAMRRSARVTDATHATIDHGRDAALGVSWETSCDTTFGTTLDSARDDRALGDVSVEVILTPSLGPAATGIIRPRIVLPQWALELEPSMRALVLQHEWEHLAARDPALQLYSALLLALMPWNLAAWWMTRRLRAAIELDCDARVLRAEPDVRRYASLLLLVGERAGRSAARPRWAHVALVSLESSRAHLTRRILAMTTPSSRPRVWYSALLGVGACGVVSLAVAMPAPPQVVTGSPAGPPVATPAASSPSRSAALLARVPRTGTVSVSTPNGYVTDVFVILNDSARVVLRGETPIVRTDTMRIRTPFALAVDLTSGGLTFQSADSVVFDMRAVFGTELTLTSRGTRGVLTLAEMSSLPARPMTPSARVQVDSKSGEPVMVLLYAAPRPGQPATAKDTTRLRTPFVVMRGLTGRDLHVRSLRGELISVSAEIASAPALRSSATGRHIVLDGRGRGMGQAP